MISIMDLLQPIRRGDRWIHHNDKSFKVDVTSKDDDGWIAFSEVSEVRNTLWKSPAEFRSLFRLYERGPLVGQFYMEGDGDPYDTSVVKIVGIQGKFLKYAYIRDDGSDLFTNSIEIAIFKDMYKKYVGCNINNLHKD